MSTKTPADAVLIIDSFPGFQPIRLPADAFRDLHRDTSKRLSALVASHRKRFPQRAGRTAWDR
ncbi:MAG: hypothetical protein ACRCT8_10325 [Lacipirellulaceae bacterium]